MRSLPPPPVPPSGMPLVPVEGGGQIAVTFLTLGKLVKAAYGTRRPGEIIEAKPLLVACKEGFLFVCVGRSQRTGETRVGFLPISMEDVEKKRDLRMAYRARADAAVLPSWSVVMEERGGSAG